MWTIAGVVGAKGQAEVGTALRADAHGIVTSSLNWYCAACEPEQHPQWKPMRRLAKHTATMKHRANLDCHLKKRARQHAGRSASPVRRVRNAPDPAYADLPAMTVDPDLRLEGPDEEYGEPISALIDAHLNRNLVRGVLDIDSEEEDDDWQVPGIGSLTVQERMNIMSGTLREEAWFPFPNRGYMFSDVLFHAPRLRFSAVAQSAILFWGSMLGASQVPSLHALATWAAHSLADVGDPTQRFSSRLGNVYYLNSIGMALARDFSNPLIRPTMQLYPIYSQRNLKEFWHGRLWNEHITDDVLTPMIVHDGRHWFVNELVQAMDGSFFIPLRWARWDEAGCAIGAWAYAVREHKGMLEVQQDRRVCLMASVLKHNYVELAPHLASNVLVWAENSSTYAQCMPNPWRTRAQGRPVYSLPLMVWVDDVSGNVSKQWNKHIVVCLSNLSLPRQTLEEEVNIHFLGTSTHATPVELMEGVVEMLKELCEVGQPAYDCEAEQPVLLSAWLAILAGDNPMQSELSSHRGLQANLFCRRCHVGGSQAVKRSEDGYASLFEVGTLRTKLETTQHIRHMLSLASQPGQVSAVSQYATRHGIRDTYSEVLIQHLQSQVRPTSSRRPHRSKTTSTFPSIAGGMLTTETALNPLLDLSYFDPHASTPYELLHGMPLGTVKYLWTITIDHLETATPGRPLLPQAAGPLAILEMRLSSLNEFGCNLPNLNPSYLIKHRRQLIGKHFKALAQCMPFVLEDLVSAPVLEAWVILGKACPLLWTYDIDDKETYLAELDVTLRALLHSIAQVEPVKIISKPKLHLLVHVADDIRRNGPAVLFSTERYEGHNPVFRRCSVLSNRQAPSRDIARAFAQFERLRHIMVGGWWKGAADTRWVSAAPSVTAAWRTHGLIRKLLGISDVEGAVAHVVAPPKATHDTIWTASSNAGVDDTPMLEAGDRIKEAQVMYAANGDRAGVGSFVVWKSSIGGLPEKHSLGIVRMLAKVQGEEKIGVVRVQEFELHEAHPKLGCPQLVATERHWMLSTEEVVACVNTQHDCSLGGCARRTYIPQRQEREDTTSVSPRIQHLNDNAYLLNIYSLHNAQLI